jgi:hypothetical protein
MSLGALGALHTRVPSLPEQYSEVVAEAKVVVRAEDVLPKATLGVDEHRRGRAAKAVRAHRDRNGIAGVSGTIDADWERHAVFVQEGLERRGPHHVVVLEHAVHAYDGQRGLGKELRHALDLWQSVGHAARAQHLERMQEHHTPAQRFE